TFANGDIGRGLRSLAAVELRTSTSQLSALPIFSQVRFMKRLQKYCLKPSMLSLYTKPNAL
ncbi:hypothetical protein, partial [Pseudomonas viridiflava]|uniref:hypothetical protein n=1 Tax=Pseudomonas viridiflava TaxID=33069 RepID=UPI0019D2E9BC